MESVKPAKLYSCLSAVHRRGQFVNLLQGLMAFCKWMMVLFLTVFLADWLIHLPAPGRFGILGIILGFAFYKGWRNGWQYCRTLSLTRSALTVENHCKNLASLMISGIQLGARRLTPGTSATMTERTIQDAEAAVGGVDVKKIVPMAGLRKPVLLVGGLGGVIFVFAIVNMPLFMAGVTRILTPWHSAVYPTRTHIEIADKDIVVQEGNPVPIRANISGEIPPSATLYLRTGKGEPRKRQLPIAENACEYKIAAAFRSFDYSIKAGDAESGWHEVEVVTSPRITKTEVRLVYPDYMNRAAQIMETMTLTVPESAKLEWRLQLDRPVTTASFTFEDSKTIPMQVSDDGLTLTHEMAAEASGAYAFSWVEKKHGFSFDTAKHYLQVAPDQPPQIEITAPEKNLFATVGRDLTLTYRARDDHGIGDAKIIYRRNNASEQSLPFAAKTAAGRSTQEIDWDYRHAIENLEIGDSVTFTIEVSDLYPEPDGPHRVRSESRRVSFLSKEDYLKKIHEQKARLLSQLQSVYRQERAAYDVITKLDPADDAFEQTCFLESARQDILVERLTKLTSGMRKLTVDLKANGIRDKSEFAELNRLQESLAAISSDHISVAASQLRALGPSRDSDTADIAKTAETINDAARELSSLVLQLGVNEAMAVFARELHVIAQSQSALRLETLASTGKSPELGEVQQGLAVWVDRLLTELDENRDYSKAPLKIVRLARMIKDLRNAGIDSSMQKAAGLLADGWTTESARLQKEIISDMFVLECKIRVGSEREALLRAHELFTSGINRLQQVDPEDSGTTTDDFESTLSALHRDVRLLVMPAIPAPETGLLAAVPTKAPPVDDLIVAAQDALAGALTAIKAGEQDSFKHQRQQAIAAFAELSEIIAIRLDEITKVSRYAGNSGESMERLTLIRELFADQMRITEKTEDAEYYEEHAAHLAPSQLHLSRKVLDMRDRLQRKKHSAKDISSSKLVGPMLRMLKQASEAMSKASPALKAEKLGDAIEQQDRALDALQAAMAFSQYDSNGWIQLANLITIAKGVAMPAKHMKDIVAEQSDLITATQNSTPKSLKELLKIQQNLSRAVYEVSMLLEGTGSGLDFEQAMIFAGSDMGLSARKIEAGDVAGAVKAQSMAVESVRDLSRHFDASEKQFYYFVTVMEFLQKMQTRGTVLMDRLTATRDTLDNSSAGKAQKSAAALEPLLDASEEFSTLMLRATGRDGYTDAHAALEKAAKHLEAGERNATLNEMIAAEDALNASLQELRELMAHVAAVPAISPVEAPPEYNVMLDMVTLLVQQKKLGRALYLAGEDIPAGLTTELSQLEETASELIPATLEHEFMIAARKYIEKASRDLKKPAPRDAYEQLGKAQAALRHCILEYALYYVELPKRRGSRRRKKAKSSNVTMFKMSNVIKPAYDKNYGGVEGEDPESGRTEWEVLGRRDRAALNENFVRELPLEYRGFLKDYYKRLTE